MSGTRWIRALSIAAVVATATWMQAGATRPVSAEAEVGREAVDHAKRSPITRQACRRQLPAGSTSDTADGLRASRAQGWRYIGQAAFELNDGPSALPMDDGPADRADAQGARPADADTIQDGHQLLLVTDDGAMYETPDRGEPGPSSAEADDCWPEIGAAEEPSVPCIGCDRPEAARRPGGTVGIAPTLSLAGEALRPDSVFGSDGRDVVLNTEDYPWRATVALRNGKDATASFCSGVMIGPRHLLTAAHCLYSNVNGTMKFTKKMSDLRAVFGQHGSGNNSTNTPFGKRTVVGWRLPTGWLNSDPEVWSTGNWTYDYALLILSDSSFSPGWFGFTAYSTSTLESMSINEAGYPGHGYTCADSPVTSGTDKGKCAGYLYHDFGAIGKVGSATLYTTDLDNQKGQSGSPAYRLFVENGDEKRRVVGVDSRTNSDWNMYTRLTAGAAQALCGEFELFPSKYFDHSCN